MNGSHHMPTTKLTLFSVRKDERDTKEQGHKKIFDLWVPIRQPLAIAVK